MKGETNLEELQRLKMKVKHCRIQRVHVKSKFVNTQTPISKVEIES